jgi:hypothetical protein
MSGISPVPARPAAKGTSPIVWILLGGGLVAFLGIAILGVIFALAVKPSPEQPAAVAAADPDAGPNLESKDPVDAATPEGSASAKKTPPTKIAGTSPAVPPTVTSTRTAFPRSRANAEVDRVLQTAQSCHVRGDPTGTGSIRVDFEPDGRVSTLTRPPFAGTVTGSCVAARMRSIRIGPFDETRAESIEATFIVKDTSPIPSSTSTARDAGR